VAVLLAAASLHAQTVPPSPQTIGVVDSGTACVTAPTACATWQVPPGAPTLTFQVTGTFSATVTWEASADGVSWFAVTATKLATGVVASTATTTGQYAISNPGLRAVRARCTVYASGGVNVTLTRGTASTARGNDASSATGTLAAANGGTGQASYAIGDLLSADTATTLSKVADVAPGQVLASGGVGVLPAYTASPSITGGLTTATADTFNLAGIAVTSTDGVIVANSTASDGTTTVQMSPRLRWRGTAWDTVSASKTIDFYAEVLPTSAATPTGRWRLAYSLNGVGSSYPLTVLSTGTTTALGNFTAGTSSTLGWTNKTVLQSSADGLMKVSQNSGATVGLEVNVGTAVPTVANCSVGSTGVVSAHSSNTAGSAVPGSGSTACDIVFGAPPFSFAPFCTLTDYTSVILAPKISVRSTTGFTVTGLTAGDTFGWICLGGTP